MISLLESRCVCDGILCEQLRRTDLTDRILHEQLREADLTDRILYEYR